MTQTTIDDIESVLTSKGFKLSDKIGDIKIFTNGDAMFEFGKDASGYDFYVYDAGDIYSTPFSSVSIDEFINKLNTI